MSKSDKRFIIISISILVVLIVVTWTWIFSRQATDAIKIAEIKSSEAARLAAAESAAPEESKTDYSVPPIVAPKNPSSSSKSTTKDGEVIISKPEPPEPPKVEDEAQLNDPNKKPEYSQGDKASSGDSSKYDGSTKPDDSKTDTTPPKQPAPKNGDRKIVNGQEYIYSAAFKDWFKPTGGEVEYRDVELSGELIGY